MPRPQRTSVAWLKQLSTSPAHLVNRVDELDELSWLLKDYLDNGVRDGRIMLSGQRGMGKSILGRAVLEAFMAANPEQVIGLHVDARGMEARSTLNQLARQLVERTEAKGSEDPELGRYLDELRVLANNNQVNKTQLDAIATKYGVFAEAGGGTLVARLRARFTWERTRTDSTAVALVQTVTYDLLHAAVVGALELIAEKGFTTLIFFDDLDQAKSANEDGGAPEAVMRTIALRPALGIVHMRSEAMFDDVRREIEHEVSVGGMGPAVMWQILEKRLEETPNDELKKQVEAAKSALTQLATGTDNPYVFLRWVTGTLRAHRLPLPRDWDEHLGEAVQARAIPRDLLEKVARVVDACTFNGACSESDLGLGKNKLDPNPASESLSEDELRLLRRADVLIPVNRYDPASLLRLDPVLDLLRPSIAEKIRSQ